MLYHANDVKGKLVAEEKSYIDPEELMTDPSAVKTLIEENTQVNNHEMKSFVDAFNEEKRVYCTLRNNCQTFADELFLHLGVDINSLPPSAKEVHEGFKFGISSVSNLISNASGWAIARCCIVKSFSNPELAKKVFGEALELGISRCTLLQTPGVQYYMKTAGQKLISSSSGEAMEACFKMCKGAFNPLQFLQIPAEFASRYLLNKFCFKDCSADEREAYAYGLSKAASLTTAACVGLIAGPIGLLGAVIFWFAAEVVSHFIRKARILININTRYMKTYLYDGSCYGGDHNAS